jgi:hypothetical protein
VDYRRSDGNLEVLKVLVHLDDDNEEDRKKKLMVMMVRVDNVVVVVAADADVVDAVVVDDKVDKAGRDGWCESSH